MLSRDAKIVMKQVADVQCNALLHPATTIKTGAVSFYWVSMSDNVRDIARLVPHKQSDKELWLGEGSSQGTSRWFGSIQN